MTAVRTPIRRSDRRPRRHRRRRTLGLAVAVVVALPVVGLFGLRAARAGVLPGVEVDGVALGGLSEASARLALQDLSAERARARVTVEHEGHRARVRARRLGYDFDVEATLAGALEHGRQSNPLAALMDHLRAFGGRTQVAPIDTADRAAVDAWVNEVAADLAAEPREGALRFDGTQITEVQPRAGSQVQRDELAAAVYDAALAGGGAVAAPVAQVEPETTSEDVSHARAAAEQALSGDITFQRDDDTATLSPDELGSVLRTVLVDDGADASIEVRVASQRLLDLFAEDEFAVFEREAEEASVELSGGTPVVVEGSDGFAFDSAAAVAAVIDALDESGERSIPAPGDVVEAELTTAEARDLEVVEHVSEFTTEHACCETRVTNIHQIADIVDEHLILPGETFSVNTFVGERTEEKGFVGGGAIFEGEFVEQIGGGVSQFATTLFNAAWFGGYDVPVAKRHSYYISRYPEGREATLNYPTVDLQITNTSPYGLLIDTSYTDTSITVAIWGKDWVDVESETGPRTDFTKTETQFRENNDLPKGESEVIQEAGGSGFDITVTRTLTFPDGHTETDDLFTRYLPQDRIVERNT